MTIWEFAALGLSALMIPMAVGIVMWGVSDRRLSKVAQKYADKQSPAERQRDDGPQTRAGKDEATVFLEVALNTAEMSEDTTQAAPAARQAHSLQGLLTGVAVRRRVRGARLSQEQREKLREIMNTLKDDKQPAAGR